MKKLTTEEFILKAKEVHGNKYDYSKVLYINSRSKVIIICSIHGEFELVANNHLQGLGCPKCSKLEASIKISQTLKTFYRDNINPRKKTAEEFIKQSQRIHGNAYSYSKVVYTNAHTPVTIICPIHGEFLLRPYRHVNSKGCPKCEHIKLGIKLRLGLDLFIEKAKQVHGDKYDYNKVEYINNKTKVCIICPSHGEFWQTPHSHLSGKGCPCCTLKSLTKLFNRLKLSFPNEEILFEVNNKIVPWLDKQRFDIYFPKYNIAIEYNGELHYIPINRFGGLLKFKQQQNLDLLKQLKCKNHNCYLFEIKYNYTNKEYLELINNLNNIIKNYEIYP